MQPERYLSSISEDSARLARAARRGLGEAVPSCPGWDVEKLLLHVGLVHRWAAKVVRTRAAEPVDMGGMPRAPDGPERVDWFDEGAADLVAVLSETDPDTPVWTFAGSPSTAKFWYRRQAHETSIHRWDGEAAHGTAGPIDPELAVDGVDEMLDVLASGMALQVPEGGMGGSLHLHCTDAGGEWLVSLAPGRVEVSHQHAKGDAALRGTASDLNLFVWGRVPASRLELFGDASVAERWSSLVRL